MMSHGKNCDLFSENILGRVVLFFAVFFFFSNSWAACRGYSYYQTGVNGTCKLSGNIVCTPGEKNCGQNAGNYGNEIKVCAFGYSNCSPERDYCCQYFTTCKVCDTQCESDSIACINDGMSWNDDPSAQCGKSCGGQCPDPGAEEQCIEQGGVWAPYPDCECEIDTTICSEDRARCLSVGGSFSGSVLGSGDDKCCSSVCDLCDNTPTQNVFKLKREECCSQNKAPPDPNSQCSTPVQSGCGMTTSVWKDPSSNDWECQDPNNSSETMDRFTEMCSENYDSSDSQDGSSDSQSSSSGDCEGDDCGSSSSQGGSSDSQGGSSDSQGGSSDSEGPSSGEDGEGCEECKYLDSILDTLHRIHGTETDIKLCLQIPGLCPGLQPEIPVFQFDTAFLKYIRPLMDSSLKVDSLQLKALLKLDTNQLKQLKIDSVSLKNDTLLRYRVDALGNVIDTSVHSQIDTTRKWFKRIADSIGVSTDSLVAHIDSIVRHIPDSILDSIVKYQQYASDNFDSVLFGTGKGFSLVDSLIDSSVKYFKESNQKWNEYISMYGDSTQKIHGEIIDLPGRNASAIGGALGYGDTASTNLRGDLNGIREAIEGLGDTSGLGGYGGGYGDSMGRYRDSINKYYISDGRFGELVDSTEAAWGVDSLDARWDSSYAYGLCEGNDCPPCSDDSCMGSLSGNFVQRADSIARIAGDSLEASTKRQRDSLPTFWDSTFNELKQYSWFGSFDSTFLANIGAKIPNSNTCPEHCFAQDVNGTYAYVAYNMHLDWKLCRPIAPNVLNSLNAFDILKLLARILTVVTCLSILMWEVSSRRGGGIGL